MSSNTFWANGTGGPHSVPTFRALKTQDLPITITGYDDKLYENPSFTKFVEKFLAKKGGKLKGPPNRGVMRTNGIKLEFWSEYAHAWIEMARWMPSGDVIVRYLLSDENHWHQAFGGDRKLSTFEDHLYRRLKEAGLFVVRVSGKLQEPTISDAILEAATKGLS